MASVKRSVTNSIARMLIAIVILSILSAGLALISLAASRTDAEAINISGSLRMQSYRLAYDLTTNSPYLNSHIRQYALSINAPALKEINEFYFPADIQQKYQTLLDRWQELEQELTHNNGDIYISQLADYVNEINEFVLAIQLFSELKLKAAVFISIISVLSTIGLVFYVIHFSRREIVDPLNRMVTASHYIQTGRFDHQPLDVEKHNELGVLATAFTSMSSDLEKMYQSLAEKVEEKTVKLTQANRSLGVLYDCLQALSVSQVDRQCFEQVLRIVRTSENMVAIRLEIQDSGEGRWVLEEGIEDENRIWQHLPLQQDEQILGKMSWQCSDTAVHPQLIENVSNILSRGIYFNRAQKRYLQVLLMEERATIARELHDSLAQSLSFLRIQLTLLKRVIPSNNEKAMSVITDFDQALSSAYRQLRELLATFRLTIQEADLHEALNQLITPLQAQTEVPIQMHCALSSQALNAQQQVHALQIVREAVLNAIKHANASLISINCEPTNDGNNMITITDNGAGIKSLDEPEGHYGLNIMSERASRLGGTLTIGPHEEGGTLVRLIFPQQ
ncbi:nitrate/nitrite two-component system sensor histidine kinase NarQ [Budviciaceae bacterium CWB-B4]|uniref:Sensor protein n=1 Tax=Limnobaculum xujianqingii TaxID=2738837 RepID=A0A9D7FZP0_9GAMM|nr:nitrate/nitrite two-component system sensor histidine kinase NarQ [Limnobaculum xujianqingii]MBK5074458.1 nitrate/nitrite two-component system sensor histidine kinase NarQ [Limnobaculum xujianqingii]MBK5177876.1 nitrate/nitrite two-component system sensor histidine kinase NarQ [Limnobaculum xujianqingii]